MGKNTTSVQKDLPSDFDEKRHKTCLLKFDHLTGDPSVRLADFLKSIGIDEDTLHHFIAYQMEGSVQHDG